MINLDAETLSKPGSWLLIALLLHVLSTFAVGSTLTSSSYVTVTILVGRTLDRIWDGFSSQYVYAASSFAIFLVYFASIGGRYLRRVIHHPAISSKWNALTGGGRRGEQLA